MMVDMTEGPGSSDDEGEGGEDGTGDFVHFPV